jgi:hypothetical protein
MKSMFSINVSNDSNIIDLFYEVIAEKVYSVKKIFIHILIQKLIFIIFIMYSDLIIQF